MNVSGSGSTKPQSTKSEQASEPKEKKKRVKKVSSSSETPSFAGNKKHKKARKIISAKKALNKKKALRSGSSTSTFSAQQYELEANQASAEKALLRNSFIPFQTRKKKGKRKRTNWVNIVKEALHSANNSECYDLFSQEEGAATEPSPRVLSDEELQKEIDFCKAEVDDLINKIKKAGEEGGQKKEEKLTTKFKKKLKELDFLVRKLVKKSSVVAKNLSASQGITPVTSEKDTPPKLLKPVFSSQSAFDEDFLEQDIYQLMKKKFQDVGQIPKLVFASDFVTSIADEDQYSLAWQNKKKHQQAQWISEEALNNTDSVPLDEEESNKSDLTKK